MRKLHLIYLLILISFSLKGQPLQEGLLNTAISYTESNRHLEAIKVCDRIITADTANENAFFLRGVNKYLLADYEGAIADFDSTLTLDPRQTDAYLFRAKAKKAMKNYWGALKDYNRAKDENLYSTVTSLAGDFLKSVFR